MKTTTIPKNKEHAWKLACLHKGKTLTLPDQHGKMKTGEIVQVYFRNEIVVVCIDVNNSGAYIIAEV